MRFDLAFDPNFLFALVLLAIGARFIGKHTHSFEIGVGIFFTGSGLLLGVRAVAWVVTDTLLRLPH